MSEQIYSFLCFISLTHCFVVANASSSLRSLFTVPSLWSGGPTHNLNLHSFCKREKCVHEPHDLDPLQTSLDTLFPPMLHPDKKHHAKKLTSLAKLKLYVNCIYQNKFKQGALVHFEELLVPYRNVICPLLLVFIILRRWGVIFVMSAPLNHLWEKHNFNQGNALRWSKDDSLT